MSHIESIHTPEPLFLQTSHARKKWFEQMYCNLYINLLNEEAVDSIPNKSLQHTKFSVNTCGTSPSSSLF